MPPHEVVEMRAFQFDAFRCSLLGEDRKALLTYLSLRPWRATLLRRFYPAQRCSNEGVYSLEWARLHEYVGRPPVQIVYFYMGHAAHRALPVLLLAAYENYPADLVKQLSRVAAIGRQARKNLVLQPCHGV